MNTLRFYFKHSLAGYFYGRVKNKWFVPPLPKQVDYHGVILGVNCLPLGMQNVILSGDYELPEIKVLPKLISSSDQVLEIGCAIGFLGLNCLKILKVKTLVSVEPNRTTLSYLRREFMN